MTLLLNSIVAEYLTAMIFLILMALGVGAGLGAMGGLIGQSFSMANLATPHQFQQSDLPLQQEQVDTQQNNPPLQQEQIDAQQDSFPLQEQVQYQRTDSSGQAQTE